MTMSQERIQVREAERTDFDDILRDMIHLREFEKTLGPTLLREDDGFISEMGKYIDLILDHPEWMVYVAEVDGRHAGTLIGRIEGMELFCKTPYIGSMEYAFVDPTERHQGIAKALVERFEEEMGKLGITAMRCVASQNNTTAQFKMLHHGWAYHSVVMVRGY